MTDPTKMHRPLRWLQPYTMLGDRNDVDYQTLVRLALGYAIPTEAIHNIVVIEMVWQYIDSHEFSEIACKNCPALIHYSFGQPALNRC